jgi:D-cysteine desulfhydrase
VAVTSSEAPVRDSLAVLPTPVTETPRLADLLGLRGTLLVKRDDLTGFAVGGNKARPLEPIIAAARAAGSTVLVTGGTAGSNFCQAATAAAAWAGMDCTLVLAGDPSRHPNLAAALAWGASVVWTGDPDRKSVDVGIVEVADTLRTQGQRPYECPRGGATSLGATGFHHAALELAAQLSDRVAGEVEVVVGTGSGGTLAGLVSGTVALGRPWHVTGASVSRAPTETAARVHALSIGTAALLGTPAPSTADVDLVDARGPGHGVASTEGARAAELALRASGLVLDPVYSAKALGAVPQILGDRRDDPDLTTIFWHTGGLLDAVAEWEHREP